jgi:hypothetical protein
LVEHSLSSSRLESSRNELYRGMGIEDHFEWKESVDRGSQVKSSQVEARESEGRRKLFFPPPACCFCVNR